MRTSTRCPRKGASRRRPMLSTATATSLSLASTQTMRMSPSRPIPCHSHSPCQRRRRLPGGLFYQVRFWRWSRRMRRRTQRQRPLPPSREKFPFTSPHVDEAKMHASEAIEVAAPAPTVMNVAAPVAVVSVPPPDEVLPTGGVPLHISARGQGQ